jgi:elongation factor P
MINVTQLRKGVTFAKDGAVYQVLEYDHYKPGRGGAIIRTKLRNLRTGAITNVNFNSGDRVDDTRLDHHTVQYLYGDDSFYYFMDSETYEQTSMPRATLEEVILYLKEGMSIDIESYEGEPLDIALPITVELKVTDAPIGYAGDTATGANKEVTLETGLKLNVPLFVQTGDVIRIDTRTREYLTRV